MIKNLNTSEYWNKTYRHEYENREMLKKDYFRNYEEIFKKIIEIIPDESRVLDVACGPGMFCRMLKKKKPNTEIIGIDFSDFIINKNKKRDKNLGIKYLCLDIKNQLPFRKKFDAIVMTEILEHLTQPEKIVSNFMKLLKKNGHFFISCPHDRELVEDMRKAGVLGEHVKFFGHDEIFHLLVEYSNEVTFYRARAPHAWHVLAHIRKSTSK